MGRRRRRCSLSDDDSDYHEDPGSDSDFDPDTFTKISRDRKRAKADPTPSTKSRTKASISVLATNVLPDQTSANDRLSKVDSSVLARIKKALALASHEGTGEQEAKVALRMASKLMSQHSINQADVLAEEDNSQRLKRAGMSVVSIRSVADAVVRLDAWSMTAAHAMDVFFDCKHFTTKFSRDTRLEFSFYGLAEHTVAAAYAYEMVYNLILDWSQRNKSAKGLHGKNTYRRGVADGLYSLARMEKKQEKRRVVEMEQKRLEAAKKAEEEDDKRRLARLADPSLSGVKEEHKEATREGDRAKTFDQKARRVKIEEAEAEDILFPTTSTSGIQPKREGIFRDPGGFDSKSTNSSEAEDGQDSDEELNLGFDDLQPQADFDDSDDDMYMDLHAPSNAGPSNGAASDVDPPPAYDSDEDLYMDLPPKLEPKPESLPTLTKDERPIPPAFGDIHASEPEGAEWKSVHQLVAFRSTSVAIADDFLKTQKIKLKTGKKTSQLALKDKADRKLYSQGKEDAKKIDVKQRRIKDKKADD